jgi:D-glycero-D-manno-heptose 1,7-bisphosphate phosphatase
MNKAVFLDRDGVINEVKTKRVKFVNHPDQFHFLEKVPEALKLLDQSGFKLFVVTNQGGVGLGYLSKQELGEIHDYMTDEIQRLTGVEIEEVACCIHKPHEGCTCRKPEPGMISDLAKKYAIDIAKSYMIGDRVMDIEAGKKAGCQTVLISNRPRVDFEVDFIYPSLYEAAKFITKSDK